MARMSEEKKLLIITVVAAFAVLIAILYMSGAFQGVFQQSSTPTSGGISGIWYTGPASVSDPCEGMDGVHLSGYPGDTATVKVLWEYSVTESTTYDVEVMLVTGSNWAWWPTEQYKTVGPGHGTIITTFTDAIVDSGYYGNYEMLVIIHASDGSVVDLARCTNVFTLLEAFGAHLINIYDFSVTPQ